MTVYLIHLEPGLPQGPDPRTGKPRVARHYIGYTRHLAARLKHHANGTGARLLAVARERGARWVVARTWPGGGRVLEQRLKRWHNAARLCPLCNKRPVTLAASQATGQITQTI